MKTYSRHLFAGTALAWFLAATVAAFAQETPKPDDKPSTPAPAAAPAATQAPASATPPAAPADDGKSSELRRLDTNATPAPADTSPPRRSGARVHISSNRNSERVAVGHDVTLDKGEKADAVVAVLGSATSDGDVGDAIVSVLGNTRSTGTVGDSAVSVLGSTYVNGRTGGDVVAVLGDVDLGPNADVGGDVVAVGGKVTRDPKATVHGDVQNVGVGPSFSGPRLEWLRAWFRECALYGRVLWFGPHLEWAWIVAIIALLLYVVIALIFRGGVEKGVTTFETRPGSSILASIITMLLSPVLIVLLCITIVGIALVPFIATALLLAVIFGKAIMLAWLGRRFTKFFGDGPLNHPAFAVLVGGVIVMGLYMIPVVGFLAYKIFKVLGLGVVVYMIINGSKRERPAVAAAAATPTSVPAAGVVAETAATNVPVGASTPPLPMAPVAVPPSTLPRAGFWIRTGALLLDIILIGLVVVFCVSLLPHKIRPAGPPQFLLAIAAYGAIMWKLKGTTIGGVVCGLKVVRLDGREIDWTTAIVRALSCFLSFVVCGLGFIWVVIDDDKQSWHDKIAGTTVVRVPKGMALV